jgi:hypothetical protein
MDQKTKKKMKLTLKRETVRTLDDRALYLLDGVAGGTRQDDTSDPAFCGHYNTDEQTICWC